MRKFRNKIVFIYAIPFMLMACGCTQVFNESELKAKENVNKIQVEVRAQGNTSSVNTDNTDHEDYIKCLFALGEPIFYMDASESFTNQNIRFAFNPWLGRKIIILVANASEDDALQLPTQGIKDYNSIEYATSDYLRTSTSDKKPLLMTLALVGEVQTADHYTSSTSATPSSAPAFFNVSNSNKYALSAKSDVDIAKGLVSDGKYKLFKDKQAVNSLELERVFAKVNYSISMPTNATIISLKIKNIPQKFLLTGPINAYDVAKNTYQELELSKDNTTGFVYLPEHVVSDPIFSSEQKETLNSMTHFELTYTISKADGSSEQKTAYFRIADSNYSSPNYGKIIRNTIYQADIVILHENLENDIVLN